MYFHDTFMIALSILPPGNGSPVFASHLVNHGRMHVFECLHQEYPADRMQPCLSRLDSNFLRGTEITYHSNNCLNFSIVSRSNYYHTVIVVRITESFDFKKPFRFSKRAMQTLFYAKML